MCDAFEWLLQETIQGMGWGETAARVSDIGRLSEFCGEVRGWGWDEARCELDRLRSMVAAGEELQLDCHCYPLRCHASSIAAEVVYGLLPL